MPEQEIRNGPCLDCASNHREKRCALGHSFRQGKGQNIPGDLRHRKCPGCIPVLNGLSGYHFPSVWGIVHNPEFCVFENNRIPDPLGLNRGKPFPK